MKKWAFTKLPLWNLRIVVMQQIVTGNYGLKLKKGFCKRNQFYEKRQEEKLLAVIKCFMLNEILLKHFIINKEH